MQTTLTHGSNPIGVDREKRIIRGCILAQEGGFKTPDRGRFSAASLGAMKRLVSEKQNGITSYLQHPTILCDGLGKLVGKMKDPYISFTTNRHGERAACVRGDLYFARAAAISPWGDLANYVMTLAEEHPDALGCSLVLEVIEEREVDSKGKIKRDSGGNILPPLWYPTRIHGADLVAVGDAVDSLLSRPTNPKRKRSRGPTVDILARHRDIRRHMRDPVGV